MADISEKIAKAEEEIRQLQNKRRKLLNQQKSEERKMRTRRLIERGAILESFLEQPEQYENEQIKGLLMIALRSEQAQEYLRKIRKESRQLPLLLTEVENPSPMIMTGLLMTSRGKEELCIRKSFCHPMPHPNFQTALFYGTAWKKSRKRRFGEKRGQTSRTVTLRNRTARNALTTAPMYDRGLTRYQPFIWELRLPRWSGGAL